MKTRIATPVLIMLTVLAAITTMDNALARPTAKHYIIDKQDVYTEDSDINYKPVVGNKNLRLNNINTKVIRDFLSRYKKVSNETWYKVEGGYVAKFTIDEVTSMVTYKRNGEWLYTISSYDEQHMPEAIKALVKVTYGNYDIVNVKEIQVPRKDSTVYLVYIRDATSIKELRIGDGEMEILHDYIRG